MYCSRLRIVAAEIYNLHIPIINKTSENSTKLRTTYYDIVFHVYITSSTVCTEYHRLFSCN